MQTVTRHSAHKRGITAPHENPAPSTCPHPSHSRTGLPAAPAGPPPSQACLQGHAAPAAPSCSQQQLPRRALGTAAVSQSSRAPQPEQGCLRGRSVLGSRALGGCLSSSESCVTSISFVPLTLRDILCCVVEWAHHQNIKNSATKEEIESNFLFVKDMVPKLWSLAGA